MWSIISREVEKTRSNCFKNAQNPGLLKIVLQSTLRIPCSNMKHKSPLLPLNMLQLAELKELDINPRLCKTQQESTMELQLQSCPRCVHFLLH